MASVSFQMSNLLRKRDNNKVATLPSSSEIVKKPQPPKKFNLVPGVEIISYLPLQMSLYFNVYYAVFWFIALIVGLELKVAELAGFWLLTLLQLPLVTYLMANVNTIILPLEWVVNAPMVFFLLSQVLTGLRALQLIVQAQSTKYHLTQLHARLGESNLEFEKKETAYQEETGL